MLIEALEDVIGVDGLVGHNARSSLPLDDVRATGFFSIGTGDCGGWKSGRQAVKKAPKRNTGQDSVKLSSENTCFENQLLAGGWVSPLIAHVFRDHIQGHHANRQHRDFTPSCQIASLFRFPLLPCQIA